MLASDTHDFIRFHGASLGKGDLTPAWVARVRQQLAMADDGLRHRAARLWELCKTPEQQRLALYAVAMMAKQCQEWGSRPATDLVLGRLLDWAKMPAQEDRAARQELIRLHEPLKTQLRQNPLANADGRGHMLDAMALHACLLATSLDAPVLPDSGIPTERLRPWLYAEIVFFAAKTLPGGERELQTVTSRLLWLVETHARKVA